MRLLHAPAMRHALMRCFPPPPGLRRSCRSRWRAWSRAPAMLRRLRFPKRRRPGDIAGEKMARLRGRAASSPARWRWRGAMLIGAREAPARVVTDEGLRRVAAADSPTSASPARRHRRGRGPARRFIYLSAGRRLDREGAGRVRAWKWLIRRADPAPTSPARDAEARRGGGAGARLMPPPVHSAHVPFRLILSAIVVVMTGSANAILG